MNNELLNFGIKSRVQRRIVESVDKQWREIQEEIRDMRIVLEMYGKREWDYGHLAREVLVSTAASTSVLALAFTEQGLLPAKSNYFLVSGSQEYTGEIRSTQLFLSGVSGTSTYSLLAGLTTIPARMMLPITGSNGYPGVG